MRDVKTMILDVLSGLAAFGLLLAGALYTSVKFHLRLLFVATACLFLLAGFFRGRRAPEAFRVKGLLVSLGGLLPTAILMMIVQGLGTRLVFASLALTMLLFAASGVQARREWAGGARARAAGLLGLPLTLIVLGTAGLMPHLASVLFTRRVDRPAPPFSMTTFDGKVVNSADLKGSVVILGFWATWCPPCRDELAKLSDVHARYKNDPKVQFWAVNVSWGGETPQKAADYAREAGLELPLAFDSRDAARSLSVQDLPGLVILDEAGRVRVVHVGYDASEPFVAEVTAQIEDFRKVGGKSLR